MEMREGGQENSVGMAEGVQIKGKWGLGVRDLALIIRKVHLKVRN